MVNKRDVRAAVSGLAWSLLLLAGCPKREAAPPPVEERAPIQLTDVTQQSGVDFVHTDGSGGRRYIVEPMSAGLALLDYDGDGLTDIYFLNGAPMRGTEVQKI